MLKDLFTRNLSLKVMAVILAVILWGLARYWLVK